MEVPFIDLQAEYSSLSEDISDAITRVLERGQFILGEEVTRFEDAFAGYVGTEHAIGVNSGSDAIELALRALDVGDGDEVITVSHTYAATANAILEAGSRPRFVDVDEQTYCMDPEQLKEQITADTAAIIPVHIYGHPCDMNAISDLAADHDLSVVEDAAQAHGATIDGQAVGSIGDVGCFSFYPVKNLGAYGDGGMIVTDKTEVARDIDVLRNCGEAEKYHHERVGINSRLDELQAAILNEKLPRLDAWNERRREIAAVYDRSLDDSPVLTPITNADAEHVYHLYVVQHERRDELRQYLHDNGIQTLIHYPVPVHEQPAYESWSNVQLPVTAELCDRILSLPISPWHKLEEIEYVCNVLNDFDAE